MVYTQYVWAAYIKHNPEVDDWHYTTILPNTKKKKVQLFFSVLLSLRINLQIANLFIKISSCIKQWALSSWSEQKTNKKSVTMWQYSAVRVYTLARRGQCTSSHLSALHYVLIIDAWVICARRERERERRMISCYMCCGCIRVIESEMRQKSHTSALYFWCDLMLLSLCRTLAIFYILFN